MNSSCCLFCIYSKKKRSHKYLSSYQFYTRYWVFLVSVLYSYTKVVQCHVPENYMFWFHGLQRCIWLRVRQLLFPWYVSFLIPQLLHAASKADSQTCCCCCLKWEGDRGEEEGNERRWDQRNQGKKRCDSNQIIGQSSHNVSNSRLTSTALIWLPMH